MNNPLQINKLSGGKYASLVARARALMVLQALVKRLLPEPLNEHCRVLAVRDETLILATSSPVWAARLRFHAPGLVKQLSDHKTVKLRTVRVRVRPPEKAAASSPARRQPPLRPGKSGAAALQQAAQTVSDPGLKTALLRLANRQNFR
ncbi:DUF721 domain-containing protein [Gammaproteobacteria bacterium]|nr:DUF721 domain-containing protein [Gammaproteobacteria bacterium]